MFRSSRLKPGSAGCSPGPQAPAWRHGFFAWWRLASLGRWTAPLPPRSRPRMLHSRQCAPAGRGRRRLKREVVKLRLFPFCKQARSGWTERGCLARRLRSGCLMGWPGCHHPRRAAWLELPRGRTTDYSRSVASDAGACPTLAKRRRQKRDGKFGESGAGKVNREGKRGQRRGRRPERVRRAECGAPCSAPLHYARCTARLAEPNTGCCSVGCG